MHVLYYAMTCANGFFPEGHLVEERLFKATCTIYDRKYARSPDLAWASIACCDQMIDFAGCNETSKHRNLGRVNSVHLGALRHSYHGLITAAMLLRMTRRQL